MQIRKTSILFVMLASLIGCSNAAPKCSDQKTVNTVLQIINQQLDQNYAMAAVRQMAKAQGKELHYRLAGITTTKTDSQTGAQFCEAYITAVVIQGGEEESPQGNITIEYKSELADNGQAYVTVYDF